MNTEKLNVFSTVTCTLGEGPLWHRRRNSLLWLDIIQKKVFEKSFTSNSEQYDNYWELEEIGSLLALDGNNKDSILVITDKSFGRLCLNSGQYTAKLSFNFDSQMRANDGAVSPSGELWFGTMEKSPKGTSGSIYAITPDLTLTKKLDNVGIPNTFCWSNDGKTFFLSDSLLQKMFSFKVPAENNITNSIKNTFIDLTTSLATPDGGAIDKEGNLWNAQWDGFKVQCYSPKGKALVSIKLPVPKVTSCCFGGPENKHLFITTAKEGMNSKQLQKHPFSGCTFVVESDSYGKSSTPFCMEE